MNSSLETLVLRSQHCREVYLYSCLLWMWLSQVTQLYRCSYHRPWHRGSALCLVLVATTQVSDCTATQGRITLSSTTHSTFWTWRLPLLPAVTTGPSSTVPPTPMEFCRSMLHRWVMLFRNLPMNRSHPTCSCAITATTASVIMCQTAPASARGSRYVRRL